MKWFFTIIFLCFQLSAFSQTRKDTVIVQTDKLSYIIGETIHIHVESESVFSLATTGDCNGTLMSPAFIKEINGEWTEPEARRQLCCGLPYSNAMMETNMSMYLGQIGNYRVVVFTGASYVMSNIFEVIKE